MLIGGEEKKLLHSRGISLPPAFELQTSELKGI